MKNRKKYMFIGLLIVGMLFILSTKTYAAPTEVDIPSVNISIDGGDSTADYVDNIKILIFLTLLSLLPSFIMMLTSFTRIIVVFSILKNAIGAQQAIPSKVLVGLAIFLTIFIMQPVYTEINETALKPYAAEEITYSEAIDLAAKPIKQFMLKETRQNDLELFVEASGIDTTELTVEDVPLYIITPAFAISELKTAFQIGFLLFIPFLVIDMIVGSVLMAMGMMMLPPTVVSLAFKLLLFVVVDGWNLVAKSLIMGFS